MKIFKTILLLIFICILQASAQEKIRPCARAGQFYPGSAVELQQTINHYLDKAKPCKFSGDIKGLWVPHAGYQFSGQIAANGYNCLKIATKGIQNLSGEFEQNGQPLSVERETTSNGTIYFAYKKGMFLQIESTSNAEGMITVVGAGMEIPQTLTTKANVAVKFGK